MSDNTWQLLALVVFICAWSSLAGLAMALHVHVIAIFAVWLGGFVCGVGCIAAGKAGAILPSKRWFKMIVGIAALGGVLTLRFWLF
jgi:hypothetical protein